MPLPVNKVIAYITHGRRLLVFRHPNAPEAGIQVPAGTMEAGESPPEAVMREALEETGLTGLHLVAFLGERDFDISPFGRDEIYHRWFFHLEVTGDIPDAWQHAEISGGTHKPILFEFF